MNNELFTRFGDPKSPHGALYISDNREGPIQIHADILKNVLELKGIAITPEIERLVFEYCRKAQNEYDREVDKEGVPEIFKTLFNFKKKAEVIRYCRKLTISEHDLYRLVHNSSQIGFKHRSKFPQFVPRHLKVTDPDISNLHDNKPRQFLKKIKATFLERRCIQVHLFETSDQWHCLYYSYQDMESNSKSHWRHGSHLHYVSHLWPHHKKKQIWGSFDKRFTNILDSIHIRLIPIPIYDDSHSIEQLRV